MKSQIQNIGIRSIAVVVILLFIFSTQAGFGTLSPCGIIDGPGHEPGLSGTYIAFSPLGQSTPTGTLLPLCINSYPLYLLHLVLRD